MRISVEMIFRVHSQKENRDCGLVNQYGAQVFVILKSVVLFL
jgi:hypothetical protein